MRSYRSMASLPAAGPAHCATKRGRRAASNQPMTSQQGLGFRLAAAKGDEALQRRPARANCQHLAAEALAAVAVDDVVLGKGGKRVGAEQFGPQVAVVAGCITAGKDVAEALREALPSWRVQHRDLVAHCLQDLQRTRTLLGIVFEVQAEIEQRDLELADQEQAGMEMPGRQQALEQLLRQALTGLVMAGKQIQGLPIPGEVLHELA